jgi:hypothetical protein
MAWPAPYPPTMNEGDPMKPKTSATPSQPSNEGQPTYLGLEAHPAAELFPLMVYAALDELTYSIDTNGLREQIEIYEGKIIDGRNRARAIERLYGQTDSAEELIRLYGRVLPDLEGLDRTSTAAEYVAIKNLHRRHLAPHERKELAGKLTLRIKAEQADKKKSEKVNAAKKAASIAGVSTATAERAAAEIAGKPQPSAKPKTKTKSTPPSDEVIEDGQWDELEPAVEQKPIYDPEHIFATRSKTNGKANGFFTDELDLVEHFEKGLHAISHSMHSKHHKVWKKLPPEDRGEVVSHFRELSELVLMVMQATWPVEYGPTMHLPDVVADDAEANLRTQAVLWFDQGRRVERLLDEGADLTAKSDDDRDLIRKDAARMISVGQRLEKLC